MKKSSKLAVSDDKLMNLSPRQLRKYIHIQEQEIAKYKAEAQVWQSLFLASTEGWDAVDENTGEVFRITA